MSTYSGLEFANSEHLSHWACEVKHSQGDENAGGTETAQLMTCTAKTTTRVQLAWPMVRPTHEDWSDRPRAAVCDHTSADSSPLFFVSDYRLISCRTSALSTLFHCPVPSSCRSFKLFLFSFPFILFSSLCSCFMSNLVHIHAHRLWRRQDLLRGAKLEIRSCTHSGLQGRVQPWLND